MIFAKLPLYLLYTLVFPGFLFTAMVGLFLTWVDRKVTAVVQSRIGPPWYQPFADMGKLMGKRMLIPKGSRRIGFLAAPLIAVAGSTLAAVIVLNALISQQSSFLGDVIVLVYLTAIPPIALIIGGSASRSPFGAIGAGREMSMVLAYELSFLLSIVTVLINVGSIRISDIVTYQILHEPIAFTLSGFIAFIVALFCTQAKLGYLPFDISEAETEIIGGPLAEYSGIGLALFKLSRAMMFLYLPVFLVVMFLGATQNSVLGWLVFSIKLLAILVLIILVKSTHARLRLDQALHLFWGKLALLALVGIGFSLIGW